MHSRGTPKTMQHLPPVDNVMKEVIDGLRESISFARQRGVTSRNIAIDPGIGFGKTAEQNLALIANLDQIGRAFENFPIMIGTSRKSFIGRTLAKEGKDAPPQDRLYGTLATQTALILKGAHILRTHDVKPAVEAARIADAIMQAR